jgi:hypothetical protein
MTLAWIVRPTAVTLTLAATLAVSCAAPSAPAPAVQPRGVCQQAAHRALQRDVARVRATAAELDQARARFGAGTPADDATRATLARTAFDTLLVALPYASSEASLELRDLAHAVARLDGEVTPLDRTGLAAALRQAAAGLPRVTEVMARQAEEPTMWPYFCETARPSVDAGTAATPPRATKTETEGEAEGERFALAGRLHAAAVADGQRCLDDIRRHLHLTPSGDGRVAAMQLGNQCERPLYVAFERCKADMLPAAGAHAARANSLRGLLRGFGQIHTTDQALSRREGAYVLERARETLNGLAAPPLSELRETAWARLAAEQSASATLPAARFSAMQQLDSALRALEQPCLEVLNQIIEVHCTPEPALCRSHPTGS